MTRKEKEKLQCIIFKKKQYNKWMVRKWIKDNGFKIDKRFKYPIMLCENGESYKVTQRNSRFFKKSTFKNKKMDKNVKGVYGLIL